MTENFDSILSLQRDTHQLKISINIRNTVLNCLKDHNWHDAKRFLELLTYLLIQNAGHWYQLETQKDGNTWDEK